MGAAESERQQQNYDNCQFMNDGREKQGPARQVAMTDIGKVSGSAADCPCISRISETSIGFSTSSGVGLILQFLGPIESLLMQLYGGAAHILRWDMIRYPYPTNHLRSVALIMLYELEEFKSIVMPGVPCIFMLSTTIWPTTVPEPELPPKPIAS